MENHRHLQNIPKDLNSDVDKKMKDSLLIPSKTALINVLLKQWVNGKIKIDYGNC